MSSKLSDVIADLEAGERRASHGSGNPATAAAAAASMAITRTLSVLTPGGNIHPSAAAAADIIRRDVVENPTAEGLGKAIAAIRKLPRAA